MRIPWTSILHWQASRGIMIMLDFKFSSLLFHCSGTRLKCKYNAYLTLHRTKSTPVSDVTVWEAASTNSMDALLATLPDESYAHITAVHDRLVSAFEATLSRVDGVLSKLTPAQRVSRREVAAVFKAKGELSSLLFAAYYSARRGPLREDAAIRERVWRLVKPATATFITYLAI
jgi:hypothetical protein